jgi:DNA-binding winged helix-turn-helix (wHTH) protein
MPSTAEPGAPKADPGNRMCVVVAEQEPERADLLAALSAVASLVEVSVPENVGGQLWHSAGPRILIASGPTAVAAVMPWMALLHSSPSTGTLALLDGSRLEVIAALERFDVWMPKRTPPSVVARQVAAQWSLMERQSRLSGPRRVQGYNLVVDLGREEALNSLEERIPLTPSEFRLLSAMAVQPGRVVDFWQLGAALPGHFRDADDAYNSVKVHIGRLRQKLSKATGWDGHLISVRGRGFLFERRAPRPLIDTPDATEEKDSASAQNRPAS